VADRDKNMVGKMEVGITVKDLDAATEFYRGIIGLEHLRDHRVPGGVIRRFAHGDDLVVKLRLDDDPPTLANPPMGFSGGATGMRYFTLQIDDVTVAVERCLAAGLAVPFPVTEHAPGVWYAIVEDPDGTWLEITQLQRGTR
jgi:catechol 2,3-dioxygenase-like lactoylglutathione lyase family enzyme